MNSRQRWRYSPGGNRSIPIGEWGDERSIVSALVTPVATDGHLHTPRQLLGVAVPITTKAGTCVPPGNFRLLMGRASGNSPHPPTMKG